jgi:hypothetical protein
VYTHTETHPGNRCTGRTTRDHQSVPLQGTIEGTDCTGPSHATPTGDSLQVTHSMLHPIRDTSSRTLQETHHSGPHMGPPPMNPRRTPYNGKPTWEPLQEPPRGLTKANTTLGRDSHTLETSQGIPQGTQTVDTPRGPPTGDHPNRVPRTGNRHRGKPQGNPKRASPTGDPYRGPPKRDTPRWTP